MCKQTVVLEIIKKNKEAAGMTEAQISLAEAQATDFQEANKNLTKRIDGMDNRINEVQEDVTEIKESVAALTAKLDILIKQHERDDTFTEFLTKLTTNKYFWWILALILCLVFSDSLLDLKELIKEMRYLI